MNPIRIKRIFEPAAEDDGYRVLVDRLWPRGIRKDEAGIDEWPKGITPSTELRKAFHHDPAQFEAFRQAYRLELDSNDLSGDFTEQIRRRLEHGPVTLLYAAKDRTVNHATVLKEWLEERLALLQYDQEGNVMKWGRME